MRNTRHWMRAAVLSGLAALAGCATSTSDVARAPAGEVIDGSRGARPGTPSRSPLTTEQQWLRQWFDGTPVVIALRADGQLAVDVPLAHAFDRGRSNVKAPLAAVLDRVVASAHRQSSTRVHIAAPSDAGGSEALALRRAQSVRSYLANRGIAPQRFGSVTAANDDNVQVRLELPPSIGDAGERTMTVAQGSSASPVAASDTN